MEEEEEKKGKATENYAKLKNNKPNFKAYFKNHYLRKMSSTWKMNCLAYVLYSIVQQVLEYISEITLI